VLIHGDTIASVGQPPPERGYEVVDADGLIVAPGFVDLQCNGAYDIDLTADPERVWELAARLPEHGVTSFLPTLVSSPPAIIKRALVALAQPPPGFRGAQPLGLHLEGPLLNPARAGAHPVHRLRPIDRTDTDSWRRDAGITMVTLAPELPGAIDLIEALVARGMVVAAGHTEAPTPEMLAGLEAGMTAVTHLFNAMAPLAHREPGPVGVALGHPGLTSTLIVDGVHVHPLVVAAVWAALGPHRMALITDRVATGSLAGRPISRASGTPRTAEGYLAGSLLTMDRAIRNLVAFTSCSEADAITSATTTPARLIGANERGRIAPGTRADLTILTPDLRVVTVIAGGSIVYDRR
jgi:N-acetylglucosamine-6-phosphate deacetylase